MSRFPEQVKVIVDQAAAEGHVDFENDFNEAVSQDAVSGEAFL